MNHPQAAGKYSQNNEQDFILEHFKDKPNGTFLDIGAFHPKLLSNTRCLFERGFKGVYIEPCASLHQAFLDEIKDDPQMQLITECIGLAVGEVEFFDSGMDAVSTTDAKWAKKWAAAGANYTPSKVSMITVPMMLEKAIHKKFDFISLDTEGNVKDILGQLDLRSLGTQMICVEWVNQDFDFYDQYLRAQGFSEVPNSRNFENLLYFKI